MKIVHCLVAVATLCLHGEAPIPAVTPAREVQAAQTLPDLDLLLVNVEARLEAGFAYKNWSAASVMTRTEYDRHGAVVKVTVARKNVRIVGRDRDEDILQATETEDGRTKDITADYAKESRKNREKERKRRASGDKGRSLDLDEIMPFAAKRRPLYNFRLQPAEGESGRKPVVLTVQAKEKDSKLWDGTFWIDPATFDIVKADVRPSDNPAFVRELWAKADIGLVDGKYLFITRTVLKIDGGFLFVKNIRMMVEDVYTDVKISN
jgi:hypothetical protein